MAASTLPESVANTSRVFEGMRAWRLPLTKLIPPLHLARDLQHAEVLERLKAHRGHCLVQAPTGYGKTALAAALVAGMPGHVRHGWLSLEADDDSEDRFSLALAAAFASAHPASAAWIEGASTAPPTRSLGDVVTAIVNEATLARVETLLVLDDCHTIGQCALHQAIAQLLLRAPRNLRLLILSRSRWPMPLASLRLKGDVLMLQAEDLALSPQECVRRLTRAQPRLAHDKAGALAQGIDGWPLAAERLAMLLKVAADRSPELAVDLPAWDQTLDDYLREQVVDPLPEQLRRFLLRTSLLSSFDLEACKALAGDADATDLLDEALQRQLFLVPHEQRPAHYRYRRFFEACLRRIAERECAGELIELHRRAAQHWLSHDELAMAMDHAVRAGDKDLMIRSVERLDERSGYSMLWESLGRVVAQLDDDTICSHRTLLVHACRYWLAKDGDKLLALLDRTSLSGQRSASAGTPTQPVDAILALYRAKVAFGREQGISEGIACAEFALQALPGHDLQGRCEAHLLLAEAKALRGATHASLAHWAHAEELSLRTGSPSQVIWSRHQQAALAMSMGNFAKAVVLQDSAILHATKHGDRTGHSMWCLYRARAEAAWEHFNLEDVTRFAEEARAAYSYCDYEGGVPVLILLARTALLLGRPAAAQERLAKAQKLLCAYGQHSHVTSYLDLVLAEHALRFGKPAMLAQLEARLKLPTRFDHEIAHRQGRAMALCQIGTGRIRSAAHLLERMNEESSDGLLTEQWRNDIWLAVCLHRLGQGAAAKMVWQECLTFAGQRQLVGSLLMAAPCAEPLLKPTVAPGPTEARLIRRLRELSRSGREDPQTQDTEVPAPLLARGLTTRDWRVFKQLLTGASNEEISNRLHLAVGTVKNTVTTIFRKLDVADREAARQLGIALLGTSVPKR